MSLYFIAGKSKTECQLALGQVVSGEMNLNVLVAERLCLLPEFMLESAQANCLDIKSTDVDYGYDAYPNWCWLASDAPDFKTNSTGEERIAQVINGKQIAIANIGDWVLRSDIKVLNDKNETCFVIVTHRGKRKADGAEVIGASHCDFPMDSFVLSPATYSDKASQYPINTPEYAAVIGVWEKYWKDGKGMNQGAIVAELMESGRFSKKRAEAIEMICRPLDRRGGGHKKKK